ncbi:MAG: hypothetical protein E7K36_17035, partial [Bacteroides sp.]|nr:hypothetical protein [Bacteroides sp.]
KDTKSLGNNKAPACESRGFVRKKQKVCILTHLHEYGVTVSAHCSQERPAFWKSYEGKSRINLDCCIFLI